MKHSLGRAGGHDIIASTTRRDLLRAGAGLTVAASGAALPAVAAPAVAQTAINLPRAPNLIVLMTDQERHHMRLARQRQVWRADHGEGGLSHGMREKAYTVMRRCSTSR